MSLRVVQKKILENNISVPPREILYHYTSFNNFVKRIVGNREFCYTDFRHLNDPTEVILSTKVLLKIIENRKVQDEELQKVFWRPFCEIFPAILNQENFHKVRDSFEQIDNIESNIYTFSFILKVDYLPMWRWYSEDGTGISIGLKPDYFDFRSKRRGTKSRKHKEGICLPYTEHEIPFVLSDKFSLML